MKPELWVLETKPAYIYDTGSNQLSCIYLIFDNIE